MKLIPLLLSATALQCHAGLHHLYAGSYTGGDSASKGITHLTFDSDSGALTVKGTAAEAGSPSFLIVNKDVKNLYSVNEGTAGVTAYLVVEGGKLQLQNCLPVSDDAGAGPCHLCLVPQAGMLVVANYSAGSVATFSLKEDGSLKARTGLHQHKGSGPNEGRQKGPHAHGAVLSPGGGYVLVNDLGTDSIHVYKIDAQTQTLTESSNAALAPGCGPRHGAFAEDGKTFYSLNELNSTVTAMAWDEGRGTLTAGASASTLPAGNAGNNSTAEIQVMGNTIYCSNRGHDTIAVFSAAEGGLKPLAHAPCGGKTPRNFILSPDGKWLLAAHQDSSTISVLPRSKDGLPGAPIQTVNVGKPVSLVIGGLVQP